MKHYYQFPVESEAGQRLADFHRLCIEAEAKAEQWAKKMGAKYWFEDPDSFAGGVAAVQFEIAPTKRRWRKAGTSNDGQPYYVLDVPAKAENLSKTEKAIVSLEEERRALPRVSVVSLYSLLGAHIDSEPGKVTRLPASTPVFFQYGDQWFVGIDIPVLQDGFTPITESVFSFQKSLLLEAAKNSA